MLANVRSSDEFLEFLAVLYFRRRVRHICPKKIFLVILLPHLRPQSSRISALEENPIIINIKTKTFPDDFKDNFAAVERRESTTGRRNSTKLRQSSKVTRNMETFRTIPTIRTTTSFISKKFKFIFSVSSKFSLFAIYLEYFIPVDGIFPIEKTSLIGAPTLPSPRTPSRTSSILKRPLASSSVSIYIFNYKKIYSKN